MHVENLYDLNNKGFWGFLKHITCDTSRQTDTPANLPTIRSLSNHCKDQLQKLKNLSKKVFQTYDHGNYD